MNIPICCSEPNNHYICMSYNIKLIDSMIEAPDFNAIKEHPTNRRDALCCIVFAPKFHRPGYEGIISRCEYLNARSREYIHFYCAGYGAY